MAGVCRKLGFGVLSETYLAVGQYSLGLSILSGSIPCDLGLWRQYSMVLGVLWAQSFLERLMHAMLPP